MEAVKYCVPLAEHRRCARHIYARFAKTYRAEEFRKEFWICARACNKVYFRKRLDILEAMPGGKEASQYLQETYPPAEWCQAFFNRIIKCDVVDNNMCETFNGVILEARGKPIITMLEDIRLYMMRRFGVLFSKSSLVFYFSNCIIVLII